VTTAALKRAALRRAAADYGQHNRRVFPWRQRPTPYRTLVAEVLLQHTPAARVVPVFEDVASRWPTFEALARARTRSLEAVLHPLGLQRRRSVALIRLARAVHEHGEPGEAEEWSRLPGVGPYTAGILHAVIAKRPAPFVDGGIARLLRRYYGLRSDARPSEDRPLWKLAGELVAGRRVRLLAWGLVDLARELCRKKPACPQCPLRARCRHVQRRARAR
jgi:A/G-specific adenine glycosylase